MTEVNTEAQGVNAGISAVSNALIGTVEGLIEADVPTLKLPIINYFFKLTFSWVAGYFVKALETGSTFMVIDLQVGTEEAGVSQTLAALIAAEKGGNPSAIQTAIQNYANSQSALIHSDGSATAST